MSSAVIAGGEGKDPSAGGPKRLQLLALSTDVLVLGQDDPPAAGHFGNPVDILILLRKMVVVNLNRHPRVAKRAGGSLAQTPVDEKGRWRWHGDSLSVSRGPQPFDRH
jgi:hypothetical protein